jgi:PPOX class probable F420-dependent enzyme
MPSSPPGTAERRLAEARVGRLATVTADGRPHVVAVCFALAAGTVYTAIDAKPKSGRPLRRLANVRATGRASLLVDHYEEDWSQLWWVRVDGPAEVLEDGPERAAALDALADKYEQYRAARPEGAVIALRPERWVSWPEPP